MARSSRPPSGESTRRARLLFGILGGLVIIGGLWFGYRFFAKAEQATVQVAPPAQAVLGKADDSLNLEANNLSSQPGGPGKQSGVPDASQPGKQSGVPGASQPGEDGPPPAPTPFAEKEWDRPGRVNILLLGVDQRQCQPPPSRTDVMMVLTMDPKQKTAALLSIPRDLWVNLPGKLPGAPAQDRINAANVYGELGNYPGGGPALAMRTVETNLGIPINYYVKIDFGGFEKVVNTLGGIDVDVPTRIQDENGGPDCQTYKIDIQPGFQHMDGATALAYLRERYSDSDFDRSKRQQLVLRAIRDKAMSLDELTRLPQLYQALSASVDTNIPFWDIFSLARLGSSIPGENIKNYFIDGSYVTDWTTPGGAMVLLPKREEIAGLLSQIFDQPAATSQQVGP